MQNLYKSMVACCVALACGACMNPAPLMPGNDHDPDESAMFSADCDAAPPRAAGSLLRQADAANAPGAASARVHTRMGACRGASPPTEASCDHQLSGWYALAYDLDVVYQDEAQDAAYDPGRGQLQMVFKAALRSTCSDAPPEVTSLQLCGMTLPALTSAADGGMHALTIPDAAWDRPTQPQFETRVRAADNMDVDPTRIMLGIEPQAEGSAWPSFQETPSFDCGGRRQGSACFPDHDGDGQPGITVELPHPAADVAAAADCGDWNLTGVRTEATPWVGRPRANRLFLGLRTQLQGNFAFDEGCEGGVGAADAEDVALRVLDCELDDGARCNALQATYVDQHAPIFHVLRAGDDPAARLPTLAASPDPRPSQGGFLTAKRLAPTEGSVSCQDVRAALARPRPE